SDREISASANRESSGGGDLRSLAAANFYVDGIGTVGAECAERNVAGRERIEELHELGVCLFDPNTQMVVPSARRTGLVALFDSELTRSLELHLEASYLSSEAEGRRDPVPWSGGVFPATNPWNPFGVDVLAEYRFTEAGQRVHVVESDST